MWDQDKFNDPAHQAALAEADWAEHPRVIEDQYTLTYTVVVATLMHSLLRHAARVKIANLAQLVNVIAPIMTAEGGGSWRQGTFYPFARIATHAREDVLEVDIDAPGYSTNAVGDVPLIDAIATSYSDRGRLALFIANQSESETGVVEPEFAGLQIGRLVVAEIIASADRHATNTIDYQHRVAPREIEINRDKSETSLTLPPISRSYVIFEAHRIVS